MPAIDDTHHEAERISRQPRPYARAARSLTRLAGSRTWVGTLSAMAVVWTVVGLLTGFPRWWELVITIGFPFLTLALLALVQHSQNHDSNAVALKLDELIHSISGASDSMLRIEEASEEDLERLQSHFGERAKPRAERSPA